MNVRVHELMTETVLTTEPHANVEHVRRIMERNKIGAIPVVDSEGQPVGIVSISDMVPELKPGSPVSKVMTDKVYTVPQYDDVSTAARVMRNQRIHRVVVTQDDGSTKIVVLRDATEAPPTVRAQHAGRSHVVPGRQQAPPIEAVGAEVIPREAGPPRPARRRAKRPRSPAAATALGLGIDGFVRRRVAEIGAGCSQSSSCSCSSACLSMCSFSSSSSTT